MALKLKWDDNNVIPTATRIYRGDSELNTAALPAPLVELADGVTEWVDPEAEFGKTYYYVFGSKTDNDEVFTPNQKLLVADNRGVGPSVLQAGSDVLGYYGKVLSADFVNSSHIIAAGAKALSNPNVTPSWHKFVRNGKVLYVPDQSFGFTTYNDLYAAGFVFGTDSAGPEWANVAGLTPVNQQRVIEFKGNRYIVRLMKGFADDGITLDEWTALSGKDMDSYTDPQPNEFNDLLYPLVLWVPLYQRLPNIENNDPNPWLYNPYNAGYNTGNQSTEIARGRILCQERYPTGSAAANSVLTRGQRATAYSSTPSYSRGNITAVTANAGNAQGIWLPVLELLDDVTMVKA